MSEVIIDFKSEGLSGVVAAGAYLMDAAKRVGVKFPDDCCINEEGVHYCLMKISSGADLLSVPTKLEMELLNAASRKNGERLSCQAKIEKAGEIEVMSVKKKPERAAEEKEDREAKYREEFKDLPLEKKIASLVELEAIALGETFSFVFNSPYKAFGKVMDAMAEFGLKLEKEDREAKKPKEHKETKTEEKAGKTKQTRARSSRKTEAKTTTKRKTTKRRPAAKKEENKD